MKKILILISTLLMGMRVFAADPTNNTVMVDMAGVVTYPLNFFTANGIGTSGTVTALDVRVQALESTVPATSNALNARIIAATNETRIVSDRVTVLETNTATLAQGIAATNAQARVAALEGSTYVPYDGTNITITGTMTANSFSGDGSLLTGVSAAVTAGVNSITVGGVTNTGNLIISGNGISAAGNTITVSRVEYITKNIVPTTDTYELIWEQPRDEDITLSRVWAKCDAGTCTFDIIVGTSNGMWRTYSTNTAPITATISGVTSTNFINATIAAGTIWGVRITDANMATVHNLTVGMKVAY